MDTQARIRRLMEERGWSEYRLAKEAGLSQSTITNVFKRNHAPTLPTLEAICMACGITLAQFFSEDNHFSEEQNQLFSMWAVLSEEQKKMFIQLIGSVK